MIKKISAVPIIITGIMFRFSQEENLLSGWLGGLGWTPDVAFVLLFPVVLVLPPVELVLSVEFPPVVLVVEFPPPVVLVVELPPPVVLVVEFPPPVVLVVELPPPVVFVVELPPPVVLVDPPPPVVF